MKKIKINTKNKSYNIYIGNDILSSIVKKAVVPEYKNLFLVVDANVWNKFEDYLTKAFRINGIKTEFFIQKSGEINKSNESLNEIISSLIKNNFGRDTLLCAIGGGITGDLAGFAASVFMRGVKYVHIPTTLLAAVDSSIGGKTGINFDGYKNIVGAFHQPEFVIIDTKFLSTLPGAELNSGAGELIKYAFLTDEDFYNYLNTNFNRIFINDEEILTGLIYKSVLFKGNVISEDEHEKSLRKILNLGHTFAHAYESVLNYSVKHGEAVCAGIISALYLSHKKRILTEKKLTKLLQLPLKMKLPDSLAVKDIKQTIKFMYGDKKNREGEIRFVLLQDIGRIITDIKADDSDITYAVEMTNKLLTNKN